MEVCKPFKVVLQKRRQVTLPDLSHAYKLYRREDRLH
uniref:Uncharacterized protein n=1 Tax=Arundo donax TaxID=35708 RepID=A0A0A8XXC2_ARUDO